MMADAGKRLALDPVAAATATARLGEIGARLAAVRAEMARLTTHVDAAIGVGEPAGAFRRGFEVGAMSATEALDDLAAALETIGRVTSSGVETLMSVDADLEQDLRGDGG